jgi:hypothetical protein
MRHQRKLVNYQIIYVLSNSYRSQRTRETYGIVDRLDDPFGMVRGGVRIVLEGLTGTGKSSVIGAMRHLELLPELVVSEEETFGNAMNELARTEHAPTAWTWRLPDACKRVSSTQNTGVLLERFHLSYYAISPNWTPLDPFDTALADMGFGIVLLTITETAFPIAGGYHGKDWQDFGSRFGSERAALEALRISQARRLEALEYSRLPSLVLDTQDKDWNVLAQQIARWATA